MRHYTVLIIDCDIVSATSHATLDDALARLQALFGAAVDLVDVALGVLAIGQHVDQVANQCCFQVTRNN